MEIVTIITGVVTFFGGLTALLLKLFSFVKSHFDVALEANKEAYNAITEKAAVEKQMRVEAEMKLQQCNAKVKELAHRLREPDQ